VLEHHPEPAPLGRRARDVLLAPVGGAEHHATAVRVLVAGDARSVVLFPEPDAPTSASSSPARTSSERASTAGRAARPVGAVSPVELEGGRVHWWTPT
jgi:hypothetical protein